MFIGTFENKVDRKGRVSVPAQFRQALGTQSFSGIIAYQSNRNPAIEACGMDFMEKLQDGLTGSYDYLTEDADDLGTLLFADSFQLPFDGDGRVILPPELTGHAGITERAAFVGFGRNFQIWEPAALTAFKRQVRERAKAKNLSVPLRPGTEPGKGAAS